MGFIALKDGVCLIAKRTPLPSVAGAPEEAEDLAVEAMDEGVEGPLM
jgi:hypothetical protein